MSRSRKPDPSKGRDRALRWTYDGVPNGSSSVGYLAGPTYGVYTHYTGATKPCRREFSDSKLICAHCESGVMPKWTGYVPFYDRDLQRRFVMINEDLEEAVELIPLHCQIRASRAKSSKASVIVREERWCTKNLPSSPERMLGVDLEPALLLIWKDPELHAFCRKENDPARVIAERFTHNGKPLNPDTLASAFPHLAERMKNKTSEPTPLVEVLETALPNATKPSSNGKHRTKR